MKRTALSILVFLVAISSAKAAETTDRAQSLPDANPACMDRNGPDCVLQGATVPSRRSPPPTLVLIPPVVPVIIPPAVLSVVSPGIPDRSAPLPQTTGSDNTPSKLVPSPPAQGVVIIAPQVK